jgi:hypothetical protein
MGTDAFTVVFTANFIDLPGVGKVCGEVLR